MRKTVTVPGKPVPKGRAVPIKLKSGHVKMVADSKTRTYENAVGKAWRDAGGPKHEGPVSVSIVVMPEELQVSVNGLDVPSSPVRSDVDNVAKSVLDGLNGVAWDDDVQVHVLNIVKVVL